MILTTLSTLQRGQKISVMSLFTKTNMTSNGTKGEVPLYFKIMTTSLSNQSFFKNHSGPANNTTNFFRPKYWLTTFAILTPRRCYTFYIFFALCTIYPFFMRLSLLAVEEGCWVIWCFRDLKKKRPIVFETVNCLLYYLTEKWVCGLIYHFLISVCPSKNNEVGWVV